MVAFFYQKMMSWPHFTTVWFGLGFCRCILGKAPVPLSQEKLELDSSSVSVGIMYYLEIYRVYIHYN